MKQHPRPFEEQYASEGRPGSLLKAWRKSQGLRYQQARQLLFDKNEDAYVDRWKNWERKLPASALKELRETLIKRVTKVDSVGRAQLLALLETLNSWPSLVEIDAFIAKALEQRDVERLERLLRDVKHYLDSINGRGFGLSIKYGELKTNLQEMKEQLSAAINAEKPDALRIAGFGRSKETCETDMVELDKEIHALAEMAGALSTRHDLLNGELAVIFTSKFAGSQS